MSDGNAPGLGDLEGAVLAALWEHGPLTTPGVHALVGQPRGLAYTTILTVLQRLARKGLATRTTDAKAHVYSAAVSRDEFDLRRARELAVDLALLGSAGVTAFLAETERLNPGLLAELRGRLGEGP